MLKSKLLKWYVAAYFFLGATKTKLGKMDLAFLKLRDVSPNIKRGRWQSHQEQEVV